eukprot:6324338-Prymnesium_polylepis.1
MFAKVDSWSSNAAVGPPQGGLRREERGSTAAYPDRVAGVRSTVGRCVGTGPSRTFGRCGQRE